MKAEHRKELPTGAITQRVGHWLKDVNSRPSTSSILLCLAVLLVVVLVVGWRYYSRQATEATSAAWLKYDGSTTVEDLKALAKKYPGTTPALMARFEEARVLLRQGLDKYAAGEEKERTEAHDKLVQAGDLYAQLANDARDYPLLVQEALMGAAKARESQGDLDGALKYYKDLAGRKPESDLTRAAADSARTLEDPAARAKLDTFYGDLKQLTSAKAPPPAEHP